MVPWKQIWIDGRLGITKDLDWKKGRGQKWLKKRSWCATRDILAMLNFARLSIIQFKYKLKEAAMLKVKTLKRKFVADLNPKIQLFIIILLQMMQLKC